jgi:hypothetical protein
MPTWKWITPTKRNYIENGQSCTSYTGSYGAIKITIEPKDKPCTWTEKEIHCTGGFIGIDYEDELVNFDLLPGQSFQLVKGQKTFQIISKDKPKPFELLVNDRLIPELDRLKSCVHVGKF